MSTQSKKSSTRTHAAAVGAGILLSRLVGLVRDRVFAHYFGASDAADAFRAAFRTPNFLQNLFGEGVLSASFIPVYARLDAEGRHEEASQLAEAIFALLLLVTTLLVAAGIFAAPWLVDFVVAPGFHGPKRDLTIKLVQVLFPGAALLVLSAWCLGILNSHRRFFLSYAAPVVWNAALIATLVWGGRHHTEQRLAVLLAIGSVIGSALQFLVQLPRVLKFLWPLRLRLHAGEHVRVVSNNFFPVFVSRGVVQVSAYIDSLLASFLGTGAVAALAYAQTLYTLPVSLFGMAVSAAELPAMSSELGTAEQIAQALRQRLTAGLQQIAFFVIPSAVAFVLLGDVVVATIYRSGHFQHQDVLFVWAVLAGSSVGLLASTSGRLYSSAFYALRDTRTPLKFAVLRVSLTLVLGYLCALPLPRMLGLNQRWGAAGLTFSAGLAGWLEFALLRHALHRRIGATPSMVARVARLWTVAIAAAIACYGIKIALPFHNARSSYAAVFTGACVLLPYCALYIAATRWMGIASMGAFNRFFLRRR